MLTIISTIMIMIQLVGRIMINILFDDLIYVVIGYTSPIFFYFVFIFIRKFSKLRSISERKPHAWIIGGLTCAFVGLVLYNNWIWDLQNPLIPLLNSGFMLVAAMLMSHGWEILPSLSELNWLSSLEILIVMHHVGSIPIFDFSFHKVNKSGQAKDELRDSYGAMIAAVDSVIGEILSSGGHIKEISHENKAIAFTRGKYCTFILITS